MPENQIVIIETTSNQPQCLQAIAHRLIQEKLAACVQILPPHQSLYRWNGNVETSQEQKLQAKTTHKLVAQVQQVVDQLHNYELPEFVVHSVTASEAFADWVENETL